MITLRKILYYAMLHCDDKAMSSFRTADEGKWKRLGDEIRTLQFKEQSGFLKLRPYKPRRLK